MTNGQANLDLNLPTNWQVKGANKGRIRARNIAQYSVRSLDVQTSCVTPQDYGLAGDLPTDEQEESMISGMYSSKVDMSAWSVFRKGSIIRPTECSALNLRPER